MNICFTIVFRVASILLMLQVEKSEQPVTQDLALSLLQRGVPLSMPASLLQDKYDSRGVTAMTFSSPIIRQTKANKRLSFCFGNNTRKCI